MGVFYIEPVDGDDEIDRCMIHKKYPFLRL